MEMVATKVAGLGHHGGSSMTMVNRYTGNINNTDLCLDRKALFRLVLHGLLCISGFFLGLRLSYQTFAIVASDSAVQTTTSEGGAALRFPYVLPPSTPPPPSISIPTPTTPLESAKSSRVHVGRHEILIRPWPHPNPNQTLTALHLLELIQAEQRRTFQTDKDIIPLIIITPTYVRMLQTAHLTALIHSLSLVPGPVTWIVVEAGGKTNETAALLSLSRVPLLFHISYGEVKPSSEEEQMQMALKMRIAGLRLIQEQRLDGIVVFADDNNIHSLEFFDEVRKVKWIGALSVGVLSHSGFQETKWMEHKSKQQEMEATSGKRVEFPLQGPVCNSTGHLTGWHNLDDFKPQGGDPFKRLAWASFALNAQILLNDSDKPYWIRDWLDLVDDMETPLDMVKDESNIEPLGHCGKDTLHWSLNAEAQADSIFPFGWIIDPPLEIVVPSRHTPWSFDQLSGRPPPPTPYNATLGVVNRVEKRKGRHSSPRRGSKGKRSSQHLDRRRQTVQSAHQGSHFASNTSTT